MPNHPLPWRPPTHCSLISSFLNPFYRQPTIPLSMSDTDPTKLIRKARYFFLCAFQKSNNTLTAPPPLRSVPTDACNAPISLPSHRFHPNSPKRRPDERMLTPTGGSVFPVANVANDAGRFVSSRCIRSSKNAKTSFKPKRLFLCRPLVPRKKVS